MEYLWKNIQEITDARGCHGGKRGPGEGGGRHLADLNLSNTERCECWTLPNNIKVKHPHLYLSLVFACVRLVSIV